MSHSQQRDFVEKLKNHLPKYFNQKSVLEVGSLNVNGTLRDFFTECRYIGIDVSPGNEVDVVCEGQNYNAPNNTYDVVSSAECFEHNPYWFETFQNMIRLCKDGGLVFFTCATDGRPEHGTSKTTPLDSPLTVQLGWDYYKNLNENNFRSKLNFDSYFSEYHFEVNDESHDLYFWGIIQKNQSPIPVIGVPIVNGIHWLKRLIDSIDYPVDDLFIVNNNGKGELTEELNKMIRLKHPHIKNIKVAHLPANIGCSGAWNLIIKCYVMSPYWVIANHDISFTSGLLQAMVKSSQKEDIGIVKGKEFQWDLFLIKDWVVQECGLFDENFYPAYVEDCDYHIRLMNKNIKTEIIEYEYLHGDVNYETTGSQTWRTDLPLKEKLDYSHYLNLNYISEKWGENWRDSNWEYHPYDYPYNQENIPITYTTYDLEFIRQKHMGF
jgi:SAM-dependent methyltransferase